MESDQKGHENLPHSDVWTWGRVQLSWPFPQWFHELYPLHGHMDPTPGCTSGWHWDTNQVWHWPQPAGLIFSGCKTFLVQELALFWEMNCFSERRIQKWFRQWNYCFWCLNSEAVTWHRDRPFQDQLWQAQPFVWHVSKSRDRGCLALCEGENFRLELPLEVPSFGESQKWTLPSRRSAAHGLRGE